MSLNPLEHRQIQASQPSLPEEFWKAGASLNAPRRQDSTELLRAVNATLASLPSDPPTNTLDERFVISLTDDEQEMLAVQEIEHRRQHGRELAEQVHKLQRAVNYTSRTGRVYFSIGSWNFRALQKAPICKRLSGHLEIMRLTNEIRLNQQAIKKLERTTKSDLRRWIEAGMASFSLGHREYSVGEVKISGRSISPPNVHVQHNWFLPLRVLKTLFIGMKDLIVSAKGIHFNITETNALRTLIQEATERLIEADSVKKELAEVYANAPNMLAKLRQELANEEVMLRESITLLQHQLAQIPVVESIGAAVLRGAVMFFDLAAATILAIPMGATVTALGVMATGDNLHSCAKDYFRLRKIRRLLSGSALGGKEHIQVLKNTLVPYLEERVVTKVMCEVARAFFDGLMVAATVMTIVGVYTSWMGGAGLGLVAIAGIMGLVGEYGQQGSEYLIRWLRRRHSQGQHISGSSFNTVLMERLKVEVENWDRLKKEGLIEQSVAHMMFGLLRENYYFIPKEWGPHEWAKTLVNDIHGSARGWYRHALSLLKHHDAFGVIQRTILWPAREIHRWAIKRFVNCSQKLLNAT